MNVALAAVLTSFLFVPSAVSAGEKGPAQALPEPSAQAAPGYEAAPAAAGAAWAERVKEDYRASLENGTLATMQETPDGLLPETAFRALSAGLARRGVPACGTKAYTFKAGGIPAYAIHSGCPSSGTSVRIFGPEGGLIAMGGSRPGERFGWRTENFDARKSAHHHGHGQPDGDDDGWPSGGGQDNGGPDAADDGGGCGGSDNGPSDGGYDGSGGLPF